MAVGTFAIAEPVTHRALTASQALGRMACCAFERLVCTLEGIVRQLRVRERLDLERVGRMTGVTVALR